MCDFQVRIGRIRHYFGRFGGFGLLLVQTIQFFNIHYDSFVQFALFLWNILNLFLRIGCRNHQIIKIRDFLLLRLFDGQTFFLFLQLSGINSQKAAKIVLIADFMLWLLLMLWSKLDSILYRINDLRVRGICVDIGVGVVGLHKGIGCSGGFLLTFSATILFVQLLIIVSQLASKTGVRTNNLPFFFHKIEGLRVTPPKCLH